jgi:ubiquinone/menaquinone biosynthesis C-methylase UbiE
MRAAAMNSPDRLQDLRKRWDEAGKTDPFWAVLSRPDKTGNRWAADEFFETGKHEIADVMAHAAQLGKVGKQRALDFGCGPGRLTQALASYFDQVDGVDISASMIELAGKLNQFPERCRYHLNTASDLKMFDDSAFDVVYSNITLQHVGAVYAKIYLREFIRVLRPGGLMIFQLPGRKTGKRSRVLPFVPSVVIAFYRRMRYKNHPAASMNGIPREEVVPFLESMGAEVLDVEANQAAGDGWESFRYSCRRVR